MWFIGLLVAVPLILVVAVPIGLYYAWVASILWGWFIVPVFHLPVLNMWQMYGISLTLGLIYVRPVDWKKDDRDIEWQKLLGYLIIPLIALGVGWLIK